MRPSLVWIGMIYEAMGLYLETVCRQKILMVVDLWIRWSLWCLWLKVNNVSLNGELRQQWGSCEWLLSVVQWHSPSWWGSHGCRSQIQLIIWHPHARSRKEWMLVFGLFFSFLCSLRPQPVDGTKCRAALPTLVNLVWMTSHRQAQRFVSSMILDPLKWQY